MRSPLLFPPAGLPSSSPGQGGRRPNDWIVIHHWPMTAANGITPPPINMQSSLAQAAWKRCVEKKKEKSLVAKWVCFTAVARPRPSSILGSFICCYHQLDRSSRPPLWLPTVSYPYHHFSPILTACHFTFTERAFGQLPGPAGLITNGKGKFSCPNIPHPGVRRSFTQADLKGSHVYSSRPDQIGKAVRIDLISHLLNRERMGKTVINLCPR